MAGEEILGWNGKLRCVEFWYGRWGLSGNGALSLCMVWSCSAGVDRICELGHVMESCGRHGTERRVFCVRER